MPNRKTLKSLSANAVQVVLNQVLGLLAFFLISTFLGKEDFGEISWIIAIVSTLITLTGLGMEQVIVRKLANNGNAREFGGVYQFHALISSVFFICLLYCSFHLAPSFFQKHTLFAILTVSLLLTYVSTPQKQIALGLEHFSAYSIMMATNIVVRILVLAYILIIYRSITVSQLSAIYVVGSAIELLVSFITLSIALKQIVVPKFSISTYRILVKESLPQLGALIFDSALARIDWILLGALASSAVTADYAFAYRAFELTRLPMIVLAPILLTKFSRYFSENTAGNSSKSNDLVSLLKLECYLGTLVPLTLAICWTPLMGSITNMKYGSSNQTAFYILALVVPLHYVTNFLWTMAFTQYQNKLTFYITALVSSCNVLLNFLLIPHLGMNGAALAFLGATVLQVVLYKRFTHQKAFNFPLELFGLSIILALVSFGAQYFLDLSIYIKVTITVSVFTILCFKFKMIGSSEWVFVKKLIQK